MNVSQFGADVLISKPDDYTEEVLEKVLAYFKEMDCRLKIRRKIQLYCFFK